MSSKLASRNVAPILVVDDNDDTRALLRQLLELAGYEVEEAENGAVALDRLHNGVTKPLVMLLDMMMPVMDGAYVLKALEAEGRLGDPPVILCTARGNALSVRGAHHVLAKPIELARLLTLVNEISQQNAATADRAAVGHG